MARFTVIPAYGRDYTNAKAVKADFDADRDFQICDMFSGQDGRMVNKQDLAKGDTLNVRYKRLTQIAVITKK